MAEQVVDKLIINIDVTGNASKEISNINTQLKNMGKKGKESVDKNTLFSSLSMFTGKLVVMGYALKKTVNMFSGFVKESTAYTENLNLFRVTFGKLSDEAERFANTFANTLGLDVSQVMRNIGFFNQIATGFGLVQDKAFEISKTLTQIAYDISSFFDISIEESIAKVQSGLAGELEPLRRIGYALDQATLQQLAYSLGIQKSVREMTQAEKAQLRTIAIYEQSKNVMGDLAETIESPANQLRILRQQFTLLARSIGNIIIPILTKILPIINGVVQGLTAVFNQVAKIFGFKLGEGVRETAGEFDGIAGSINNVEKAAKKMLLPFDDFLSLSRDLGEDATSGGLDLAIPTYDALAGMEKIATKANEIGNSIKSWFLNIDEASGAVKGLSDNFYALLAVIETIIATRIIGWISSLVASIKGATLATKLLTVAQQLLQTAGLFLILYSITQLVAKWDELTTGMKLAYGAIITLGVGMVAFSVLSKTTVVGSIMSVVMAFKSMIAVQKVATLGFSALGIAIGIGLFKALEGLDGKTKQWVGGILGLAGAIAALAVAVLAVQGALTLGIAIPIIVTAVSVGTAGIMTAINGAKEIQGFATGGFTPEVTGTLFQVGENGRPELMGSVRGKNAVANVQSIEKAMENAAYRGMVRALSSTSSAQQGSQKDIVLNIDGKEFARATVKNMASELNRNYRVNLATR